MATQGILLQRISQFLFHPTDIHFYLLIPFCTTNILCNPPNIFFQPISTIQPDSNQRRNDTMAPRPAEFSCGCKSTALPSGPPACGHPSRNVYYVHPCKECMRRENEGRYAAMPPHYNTIRDALIQGRDKCTITAEKEAHKAEIDKANEELAKLPATVKVEGLAIWNAYDGYWPTVHTNPTE